MHEAITKAVSLTKSIKILIEICFNSYSMDFAKQQKRSFYIIWKPKKFCLRDFNLFRSKLNAGYESNFWRNMLHIPKQGFRGS